jgi:cadmium resistance protein CadD (predicted permease)
VSFAALAVPTQWIGFLGLLPVGLGLRMWWRARRGDGDDEDEDEPTRKARAGSRVIAVALVTIANGADNVAAYVPYFATTTRVWQLAIVIGVFAAMTGLWCFVAHRLVHHPMLGNPIRRYGSVLLPFVLMALGVYLFIEGGAHVIVAGAFRRAG